MVYSAIFIIWKWEILGHNLSEQAATEAASIVNYIKYTHCRYEIAHIYEWKQIHLCHAKLSAFWNLTVPYLTATHGHTQDGPTHTYAVTLVVTHISMRAHKHLYVHSRTTSQTFTHVLTHTHPCTHLCWRSVLSIFNIFTWLLFIHELLLSTIIHSVNHV